jgi:hypothetical protein
MFDIEKNKLQTYIIKLLLINHKQNMVDKKQTNKHVISMTLALINNKYNGIKINKQKPPKTKPKWKWLSLDIRRSLKRNVPSFKP